MSCIIRARAQENMYRVPAPEGGELQQSAECRAQREKPFNQKSEFSNPNQEKTREQRE